VQSARHKKLLALADRMYTDAGRALAVDRREPDDRDDARDHHPEHSGPHVTVVVAVAIAVAVEDTTPDVGSVSHGRT